MLLKLYDLSMLCPSSTQLYIIEISDIWIEQNLAAGKKTRKKSCWIIIILLSKAQRAKNVPDL